jgi:phosphatidylglycerol:prolipoprotein diacylglycerol transferase
MVAFTIYWFSIYRYWIFYALSFLIWRWILSWILQQSDKFFNSPINEIIKKDLDWLIVNSILWIILWWRIWHIIFYDLAYYISHPMKILALSEWGMSFVWGFLGAAIGWFLRAKKNKIIWRKILSIFDLIMLVLPIGIILGRVWNYLNQELYGIIAQPSKFSSILESLGLLHIYSKIDANLRINTNFLAIWLEGILSLILIWVLIVFSPKITRKPWMLTWVFMIRYSFVRFRLEFLRADSYDALWNFIITSQILMVIFFVVGIWLIVTKQKNQ